MTEQISTFLIIGFLLLIFIIAAVAPQVYKNLQIKLYRAQFNPYKKTPLLNKVSDYNLEIQKSQSLLAIRLTGIMGVIFLILVLLLIL